MQSGINLRKWETSIDRRSCPGYRAVALRISVTRLISLTLLKRINLMCTRENHIMLKVRTGPFCHMRTISVIIIQVINRLICSEPPSAQCIDCDIYAFQCILVSKVRYQLLVTSPVVTLTSARAFYINEIFCWLLLPQLSTEKTNFIIKQVLTIEALDMTLISTTEYQYWPRQSPRSILVFSGRYNVISNTATVNTCNCIISACNICIICNILFIIKQVLTIEALDMTLISTIE